MSKMHYGANLEATMSVNLSIKNAPDELVATLRTRAARHHRSLQGELMAILERAADDRAESDDQGDVARRVIQELDDMGLRRGSESVRMIREDRDR